MSATTLKEFLVSLGFSVNQTSQKKFTGAVKEATAEVVRLGASITALNLGVNLSVALIADNLEKLMFAAKRTGASAEGFRAFGFAVSNLGGSAEGAAASIEAMASAMRHAPGIKGLIEGLGVSTEALGRARDTADIMKDLGDKFRQMPMNVGLARAGVLGIDERTFLAMREGTGEFSEHYSRMMKAIGLDTTAATKAGYAFKVELRDLKAILGALADRTGGILAAKFIPALESLNRWLMENGGSIDRLIDKCIKLGETGWKFLTDTGNGLIKVVKGIGEQYDSMDEHSKHVIRSSAFTIGAIALAKSSWFGLGLVIAGVVQDYEGWKRGEKSSLPWDRMNKFVNDHAETWKSLGEEIKKVWDVLNDFTVLSIIRKLLFNTGGIFSDKSTYDSEGYLLDPSGHRNKLAPRRPDLAGQTVDNDKAQSTKPKQTQPSDNRSWWEQLRDYATRTRNPGRKVAMTEPMPGNIGDAMEWFQSQGWSRQNAAGIVQGLWDESKLNPNVSETLAGGGRGPGRGIAQWTARDRKAAFRAVTGHDVEDSTYLEQLKFVNYELHGTHRRAMDEMLRHKYDATQSGYDFRKFYESPRALENESFKSANRAGTLYDTTKPVNITNTTNINVTGGPETAKAVESAQVRVNENLARTMRSAVVL